MPRWWDIQYQGWVRGLSKIIYIKNFSQPSNKFRGGGISKTKSDIFVLSRPDGRTSKSIPFNNLSRSSNMFGVVGNTISINIKLSCPTREMRLFKSNPTNNLTWPSHIFGGGESSKINSYKCVLSSKAINKLLSLLIWLCISF